MRTILILVTLIVVLTAKGQDTSKTAKLGLNTYVSWNSIGNQNLNPSIVFNKRLHSAYIGPMLTNNVDVAQKGPLLGLQLGYQIFPNGRGRRFDFFFDYNLNYLNAKIHSEYPTSLSYQSGSTSINCFADWTQTHFSFDHYIGYGFNLSIFKGLYLTTNIAIGATWSGSAWKYVCDTGEVIGTDKVEPYFSFGDLYLKTGLGWDFWTMKKKKE